MTVPLTSTLHLRPPSLRFPRIRIPATELLTGRRGTSSRSREQTESPIFLGLLALLGMTVLLAPLVRLAQLVLLARRVQRDLQALPGRLDPRAIRAILVRKGYRVTMERTEPQDLPVRRGQPVRKDPKE
jgi:hypothetical protein